MTDLLHESLTRAARAHGDRVAVRVDEDEWTFGDLERLSLTFAQDLAAHGIGPRDRVAMMTTNRVEFPIAVNAISRLGAAAVLLSPAWKAAEIDHALSLTGPVHAVADGPAVDLLRERLSADAVTDLDEAAATEEADGLDETDVGPDDEAILVFSSGTTGLPKAVRHTHRSIGAGTTHWVQALGLTADDRFQVATPPSHILGLLNLLAAAEAGAAVRLHRRFDLDEVLRRIETDRITLEMAVAPIALAMANHPDLEDLDLSSLRYIMWGATPVTPSVAGDRHQAHRRPLAAGLRRQRAARHRLQPGRPTRRVAARLRRPAPGRASSSASSTSTRAPSCPPGERRRDPGPQPVGDGRVPARRRQRRRLRRRLVPDRRRRLARARGLGAPHRPVEGDDQGQGLPGRARRGRGRPARPPGRGRLRRVRHPRRQAGEVPVAAVQLDPTHPVEPAELQQLVADSLATYKQLRHVVVVDTIPRLPSGKVLRRTLRDDVGAAAHGGRADGRPPLPRAARAPRLGRRS